MAAEWIIEGEPSLDMFGWELARFGAWAGKAFTKERVRDQYARRFSIHFPNEERSAGRPIRTRPAYMAEKAAGAVFGLAYGWEHPLWFAAPGEPREDTNGFTRQNWWAPVGREARMLREAVEVIDISNFARYEVEGPRVADWMDSLLANRMPVLIGRSCLPPLIGRCGGVAGAFTVTKLAKNAFFKVGYGLAVRYYTRFFR